MSDPFECSDLGDSVLLNNLKQLFLKPISRINISVHFPTLKQSLMSGGKSVSSWDLINKIKALASPEVFLILKTVKNTLEFIRFEGDLESKNAANNVLKRLEGKEIKVTGFKESLKVKAMESKPSFPSKYDWDSFFRDAKEMNEMKAGERPDTIHFQNIPITWFSSKANIDSPKPSVKIFKHVWETFGEIRHVDIPMIDPLRTRMKGKISGIRSFNFQGTDKVFEGYIQYKDYLSFVKAMDALRGTYLLKRIEEKFFVAPIRVNFDKTKHLSEESIKLRELDRERIIQEEKKANLNEAQSAQSSQKSEIVDKKIQLEERKYMIARRKLESIRLIDFLVDKINKSGDIEEEERNEIEMENNHYENNEHENRIAKVYVNPNRVLEKYREIQEAKVSQQKRRLRQILREKGKDFDESSGQPEYYNDQPHPRSEISEKYFNRARNIMMQRPSNKYKYKVPQVQGNYMKKIVNGKSYYINRKPNKHYINDWEIQRHTVKPGFRPNFDRRNINNNPFYNNNNMKRIPHPHNPNFQNQNYNYNKYKANNAYAEEVAHSYEKYFMSIAKKESKTQENNDESPPKKAD